ncbi:MAG TPA: glycosyltransferase [Chthoniobacterales bacterium]|nr:glycosyltransferase [Chthoniobacterales bacterium]
MKAFPDLTLATTLHNNSDLCFSMLRSFATNVGQVAEIVIVDDGSNTPCPTPVIDSPVRVVRVDQPLGFCKASDLALREVKTPYALLVDADVEFESGDFAGGYAEFQNSNWAWVNFRQTNFQGQPQTSYEKPLMPPWIFAAGNQAFSWWQKFHPEATAPAGQRLAEADAVHSSSTLVNMDAFRKIGGFDRWYWQCQSDIDISLRFRQAGYRIGVDLGYQVRHDGAGGKGGGPARILDLYRSRVHLYENAYPASKVYLRPLLFLRHALELVWFALRGSSDDRLTTRKRLLKGALHGYK